MSESNLLNILSVFSGAGGLDLGFESTGHYATSVCIEANPVYASTLTKNQGKLIFGTRFLESSRIINGTAREFIESSEYFFKNNQIDGIIGGPPCQPFSTIGRRLGLSDPRASTLQDFIDLVCMGKPRFFLFENVPNLAWQWSGEILSSLTKSLSFDDEYKIESKVVNAADFGAYTKRKRLVLIGLKRSQVKNADNFRFPDSTHTKLRSNDKDIANWMTVRNALSGLIHPNLDRLAYPTHHVAVTHSDAVLERFKKLKPGEQDKIRKRWRLDLDQPSNSLMAGGEGGYVFHIHPTEPRELTSRECARIQGFPDEFEFVGKPLDVAKQIVNAVPVQLGYSIAQAIFKQLRQ
jgi:DNA (cytosine-5)-methyltransferase 1